MSQDIFHDLKAGDKDCLYTRFDNKPYLISVDRVTATQFICGHTRYRRKDGYPIGGSWRQRAYPVTPEIIKQAEAYSNQSKLCKIVEDKKTPLSDDEVKIMLKALEDYRSQIKK